MNRPDLNLDALAAVKAELARQKGISQARTLPTVYRHVINVDWFRKLTWRERIKILFGYNLNVLIRLRVKHNPGDFDPIIVGEVSPFTQPSELLRDRIETDIAKLQGPHLESE